MSEAPAYFGDGALAGFQLIKILQLIKAALTAAAAQTLGRVPPVFMRRHKVAVLGG